MKDFVMMVELIDQTTKSSEKIEYISQYFNQADEKDKIWALSILCEKKSKRFVNNTLLKNWAAQSASIPDWLFEECYHTVGDLAETIALLVSQKKTTLHINLATLMQELGSFNSYSEKEKKDFFFEKWKSLDFYYCFVLNKMITGGLRLGVAKKLVIKALSKSLNIHENIIAHQIGGNWQAESTNFETLFDANSISEDISKPYPFFLAYPLESEIDSLGAIHEWQAEWKWDGIRGQIINRENEIFIWSRGEELVTDKFPELEKLKEILPNGTAIDGEIICYKDNKPLSFNILQTRISRKNISSKILFSSPVVMICYDLLEWNSKDIRNLNLAERRKKLEEIVDSIQTKQLILSPLIAFQNWHELTELRKQSDKNFAEGIMLKRLDSIYDIGRKKGTWWKWKTDPMTIDGVLLYAQKGHGRRADLFTDYTFAVWNHDVLVPFAKAYSGLTDNELKEIDQWIKKNTKEKFGPVRSVTPHLVFELAFEGINYSPRHKSGVAVRFPRILRWRKDKKIDEANSLEDLKNLIKG